MAKVAHKKRWSIKPSGYDVSKRLADELGISITTASVLARRGYGTPAAAREFLEAGESHGFEGMDGMEEATRTILKAASEGRQVTVHGDYDVDGVCATALMVRALADVGAKADWFIPSRFEDGYGLAGHNIERLAAQGTSLIVAVDCGVTSVAEVELAKEAGLDVVVVDHHRLAAALPDCPVVHPRVGSYPYKDLCATAVTYKLAQALFESAGLDPSRLELELDLVALATIADVVPLTGENRSLAARGLKALSTTKRPGLKALKQVVKLDGAEVKSEHVAFRLAPRINAAGRLYRADAGVELMLTEDGKRAAEIARELDLINRERQDIEQKVLTQAEEARSKLISQNGDMPLYTLAGEAWHQGVVGIVASRIARRYNRPSLVISIDGSGLAKGSGRSIAAYDLHAGLNSCSSWLTRFGGHAMAVGFELEAGDIETFGGAMAGHAKGVLAGEDLVPVDEIDAVAHADGVGLDLAYELERLAPFGQGNPAVKLLIPCVALDEVTPIGQGKHTRVTLRSGAIKAKAVAFGRSAEQMPNGSSAYDLSFKLEANHWNGSVEPSIQIDEIYGGVNGHDILPQCKVCGCEHGDENWWSKLIEELERGRDPDSERPLPARVGKRHEIDHETLSPLGLIASLVSTGESVAVITADCRRRAGLFEGQLQAANLGAETSLAISRHCRMDKVEKLIESVKEKGTCALIDYEAILSLPGMLKRFVHLVLLDPPYSNAISAMARENNREAHGYLHLLWGEAEAQFCKQVLGREYASRGTLMQVYRALCEAAGVGGCIEADGVAGALKLSERQPLSAVAAARCLRVLAEIGSISLHREGHTVKVTVPTNGSGQARLDSSESFQAYSERYQRAIEFIDKAAQPRVKSIMQQ